jgi:hypothetical protein
MNKTQQATDSIPLTNVFAAAVVISKGCVVRPCGATGACSGRPYAGAEGKGKLTRHLLLSAAIFRSRSGSTGPLHDKTTPIPCENPDAVCTYAPVHPWTFAGERSFARTAPAAPDAAWLLAAWNRGAFSLAIVAADAHDAAARF